ncbi:MAG: TlpA family protein disulfide reductase [Muribaculaceae bacterium]|nr:TlpA family protein disulfide reductase [Muribaculaceae bacterium]
MARILVNGNRMGSFILEQGTCALNPKERRVKGAYLNDQFNSIIDSLEAVQQRYERAESDSVAQACLDEYMHLLTSTIGDNIDNPIGYYLFLEYCYMIDADAMMAAIEQYPDMKRYARVQKLVVAAERKLASSIGKQFVDFEVEYDGKTYKLSDYVGRGKPVLVDFWASWCRPCMQEINGTLKEIYAKYADKGLDVLGVAVWDEPKNTLGAIERAEIPWPCIINAQTIPTDAYGISGIPCIILFAPDGTIVSRDLQGAALMRAVDAAMAEWGSEQ